MVSDLNDISHILTNMNKHVLFVHEHPAAFVLCLERSHQNLTSIVNIMRLDMKEHREVN